MSLGKQGAVQPDLMVTWQDMPRSPGHAFYDRLNEVLGAAGFDRFAALLRKTGRGTEATEMEARAKAIRAKHAEENTTK